MTSKVVTSQLDRKKKFIQWTKDKKARNQTLYQYKDNWNTIKDNELDSQVTL